MSKRHVSNKIIISFDQLYKLYDLVNLLFVIAQNIFFDQFKSLNVNAGQGFDFFQFFFFDFLVIKVYMILQEAFF